MRTPLSALAGVFLAPLFVWLFAHFIAAIWGVDIGGQRAVEDLAILSGCLAPAGAFLGALVAGQ
jgi:hypothetical protein